MPDASMIFDWLGILAIGLMSVTIPTYAISVSFLGRERKRAISERERRVRELQKKVKEFTASAPTDPGVAALQSEIDNYKEEIKKIKGRVDSLSVYYACFVPLLCFTVALFVTAYGFLLYLGDVQALPGLPGWLSWIYFGSLGALFLLLGLLFVSNTLIKVNHAATNPETLSSFRVSFDTGSTAERFNVGQPYDVAMIVHNWGNEMAENAHAQFYFPSEFQIVGIAPHRAASATEVSQQPSNPLFNYPGYHVAKIFSHELHEDMLMVLSLHLVMPNATGKYVVPV